MHKQYKIMIIQALHLTTDYDALNLPIALTHVRCGFPSPADDHTHSPLNLSEYLIERPAATFFARAEGDSLKGLGITDGDLLVVDRSATPRNGDVIVVAIDGQLTCKILDKDNKQLLSANENYPPIDIDSENMDFVCEGVVLHAIHHLRGKP